MKYKIVALCLLLIFAQSSFAQQTWLPVSVTDEGDSIFIRSQFESKDSSGIKILSKKIIKEIGIGKTIHKNVEQRTVLFVDCKNNRTQIFGVINFTATGRLITQVILDPDKRRWEPVVASTHGEAIFNTVCRLFHP